MIAALALGLLIAVSQARRADALAMHARLQLADQLAQRGIGLADEGDPAGGLLYLARAVELEEVRNPDCQRVRDARRRFAFTLAMTPEARLMKPSKQSFGNGGWVGDSRIEIGESLNRGQRTEIKDQRISLPAGALANSVQLRPAFSHAVGLTIRMRGARYGKWLNGTVVLIAIV